ncbi:MAG: hypothetical protein B7C24_09730 [Bacteroidetes bacterium 4572_77]|nr:MAG: hypothetical protein B7C24_09730 [Bacteroidetes bacterium 4572_77]
MENIVDENQIKKPSQPEGLRILCIFSFLGSGLSLVSNLMIFLIFPDFLSYFSGDEVAALSGSFDPEMLLNFIQSAGRFYFLISAALYFLSLLGVYYMWHLQKSGIHIYAIAQIAILLLPLIFISTQLSILPGLVLTAAFIYMYSRYLKVMS